jgi:hypothetical protein
VHYWGILVDAERFNAGGLSIKRAKPAIQDWLDRLDTNGPRELTINPPCISCHLTLTASQRRENPRPIVEGLMGQGGGLTATDRIRNILHKKVKQCESAKRQGLPLIVFLYEGDWLHISRESLEWALWGEWQLRINRQSRESGCWLAPGGLFMPDPRGQPQNTRLSAVVYGRRQWQDGSLHATLFIYHNPMARHPLSDDCFHDLPQSHVTLSDTEFTAKWSHDLDGPIQILRLP